MKSFIAGVLTFSLLTFAGCGDKGTPGGPGATNTGSDPAVGTADGTFRLDVPNLSTTLEQGETETVTISIDRGDNFDQDVTVKLTALPAGVTASPASSVIPRGQDEVKFDLTAALDAAIGDFEVMVTGNPTTGAQANNRFKLTVERP